MGAGRLTPEGLSSGPLDGPCAGRPVPIGSVNHARTTDGSGPAGASTRMESGIVRGETPPGGIWALASPTQSTQLAVRDYEPWRSREPAWLLAGTTEDSVRLRLRIAAGHFVAEYGMGVPLSEIPSFAIDPQTPDRKCFPRRGWLRLNSYRGVCVGPSHVST